MVFLGLWPLSSFLPFPSLKKGVAKKTLFYRFFATPLYNLVVTSTNNHQNKTWKRHLLPPPFWKTCFGPKHQKATKTLHPPLKTWFTIILWNPYFYSENMWTTYWPNNADQLLTLKPPNVDHLLTHTCIYIYVYVYVCIFIYVVELLSGPSLAIFNSY